MRSSESNVLPFKEFCKERKRWKSDGERSELYGGYGNTPHHVATIFAEGPNLCMVSHCRGETPHPYD